jgi:O-antigen/teichoic acid export membrane protein
MDVVPVIVMVVVPVSIGIAVVAEPMVRVLLGPEWMDAVPVIRLLAPAGAIVALTSNTVSAYLVLGGTAFPPLIMAVRIGALAAALVWLAPRGGILGVTQAELVAALASLVVSLPMLLRTLRLSVGDDLAAVWRPAAAGAVMGAVVHRVFVAMASESTLAANSRAS